jgi:hypothetical protein
MKRETGQEQDVEADATECRFGGAAPTNEHMVGLTYAQGPGETHEQGVHQDTEYQRCEEKA